MSRQKLVIEAALNGLVPKSTNPNIPYGATEIAADAAACVKAGASMLHFDARDAVTGEPLSTAPQPYRDAILAMRQQGVSAELPWHVRYREIGEASLRQLSTLAIDPDVAMAMASVEVGTDNVNDYNSETKQFIDYDFVERMAHFEVTPFFDLCRERRLRPYLGIKEPGELRHIGSYLDIGWIEPPVILKFNFSDFAPYGLPPTAESLGMYVEMIDMVMPGVPVEWFVACNGPSIWELAPAAIRADGHVQIGLGQYHPTHWRDRTNQQPTNAELVARLAELGRAHGRETASPAEASALLGLRQLERL